MPRLWFLDRVANKKIPFDYAREDLIASACWGYVFFLDHKIVAKASVYDPDAMRAFNLARYYGVGKTIEDQLDMKRFYADCAKQR
jgi:hypothetical protein